MRCIAICERQQGGILMNTTNKMSTKNLVLGAILTALVILLQFMGSFIKLGPFSISLVLIVIGAATCGTGVGAWLGFVFGIVVLISGDAAAFLAVNVPGTVITVLVKGTACGFLASLAYKAALKLCNKFAPKNGRYFAVIASAIVCPVVNTGIFLIGCLLFFMGTITEWAIEMGLGDNIGQYMILFLVGTNFLVELATNIILSPVVSRLLDIKLK